MDRRGGNLLHLYYAPSGVFMRHHGVSHESSTIGSRVFDVDAPHALD